MKSKPINEFNIAATPPQELLLRLSTLAVNGGTVTSIFASSAGRSEKIRAAREREREADRAFMEMAMAEPEQVAAFEQRLERLDEANTEALLESEEELRVAEEELDRVRESAYEITLPDGELTKVYRDGNIVRDDNGAVVNPGVIRADDIPAAYPVWPVREGKQDALLAAQEKHSALLARSEQIEEARQEVRKGGLTAERLEELESGFANMPEAAGRQYESPDYALDDSPPRQSAFDSGVDPTGAFTAVAPGLSSDMTGDSAPEIRPPRPDVSGPGPK